MILNHTLPSVNGKEIDRALLSKTRLRIYIYLLRNGKKSLGEIHENVGVEEDDEGESKLLSKAGIARHCVILEKAGLLNAEAIFSGSKGIRKAYRASQRPMWAEMAMMRGIDPETIPDEVYRKMDELAQHPRYLQIVREVVPESADLSLMRQKEQYDRVTKEGREMVFKRIQQDPELEPIFEKGFKLFYERLRNG